MPNHKNRKHQQNKSERRDSAAHNLAVGDADAPDAALSPTERADLRSAAAVEVRGQKQSHAPLHDDSHASSDEVRKYNDDPRAEGRIYSAGEDHISLRHEKNNSVPDYEMPASMLQGEPEDESVNYSQVSRVLQHDAAERLPATHKPLETSKRERKDTFAMDRTDGVFDKDGLGGRNPGTRAR